MIVATLISLNLAGAAYRPPDERRAKTLSVSSSPADLQRRWPGAWPCTILTRVDGGVVAYPGPAGAMTGKPIWLRHPSRSFLEMHWAKFVSTAITLLVIFSMHKQGFSARKLADPGSVEAQSAYGTGRKQPPDSET